jgi:RNA-binding protein
MKLTEKQKRHLRGLAHELNPVVWLGNQGVSESFLAELDGTLSHHELIKLKCSVADREIRDAAIDAILKASGATLVTRIGNVAVLYRRNREKTRIILPAG